MPSEMIAYSFTIIIKLNVLQSVICVRVKRAFSSSLCVAFSNFFFVLSQNIFLECIKSALNLSKSDTQDYHSDHHIVECILCKLNVSIVMKKCDCQQWKRKQVVWLAFRVREVYTSAHILILHVHIRLNDNDDIKEWMRRGKVQVCDEVCCYLGINSDVFSEAPLFIKLN